MTAKELLEQIQDRWAMDVQADLEHGVHWLNNEAAEKFNKEYPSVSSFGQYLIDLKREILTK